MRGFPSRFSRDAMTISLSQSLDTLTFTSAVCAEMEEGHE